MKRLTSSLVMAAVVTILFSALGPVYHIRAAENLIVNPGVEAGTTSPDNWTFNSWGETVATSLYSTTEGSSGKSLGVNVTSSGAGDAKWYHDPVSVESSKTYSFSNSYKSDVNTDIIVRYTTGANTYSYDLLVNAPASSEWTTISKDLVIPSGVSQITFFHIITVNGTLWTDNFSLVEKTVSNPPGTEGDNLIANPSFETENAGQPAGWFYNSWGVNSSTSEYASVGYNSSRSAYVATTSYTDGDAKWYHDPVSVNAGLKYTFKDYYKSTVNTDIVVQFQVGTGVYEYLYLGGAPVTTNWTQVQFDFTVPTNATHASVFHLIAGVGELWTDNYSLVAGSAIPVPGTNENQILNPSVETENNGLPKYWATNAWGSNSAIFEYRNEAQDGSKGLYVKISNYIDGDAKWSHSPVSIGSTRSFKFSNYYKSTAPSEVVLQHLMNDGTTTYEWLGTAPASANWIKQEFAFVSPDNAKSVNILHVLAQNGELWQDSFNLQLVIQGTNSVILNNSVEVEQNANLPVSWGNNSWGSNNATFEYVKNDGHTGSHSLKVNVTSYTNGDAKWYSAPVELSPGVNYTVTNFYKATVDTYFILDVTMSNGSTQYIGLPVAPASAEWTQYSATFTMPSGGTTMSIYHVLSSVGTLQTDDYDVGIYNPTPFNRALISLTFDDSWEDNVDTALPLLNQYGYKTNQFHATTFIENSELGEQTAIDKINQFIQTGHEVDSHSVTHPALANVSSGQVDTELSYSQNYLRNTFNLPVNYFATPFGSYNTAVNQQIMSYYTVHRTVDVGFNSKDNFDVSKLKVQNILNTTTADEVAYWIHQAQVEKSWLILVFHRVANVARPYDTTPPVFAEMLAKIDEKNIPVVTFTEALAELEPQL
jgi:peptidoglycan/xylan/chitin deacetylase (PgdA/CDA1 family)